MFHVGAQGGPLYAVSQHSQQPCMLLFTSQGKKLRCGEIRSPVLGHTALTWQRQTLNLDLTALALTHLLPAGCMTLAMSFRLSDL